MLFPASAVPTQPLNLTLETVIGNPTQLRASWSPPDEPNGMILNYTVTCTSMDVQSSPLTTMVDMSTIVTVLGDLLPFTNYSCAVSATTSAGEGSSTDTETAQTDEAGLCDEI